MFSEFVKSGNLKKLLEEEGTEPSLVGALLNTANT